MAFESDSGPKPDSDRVIPTPLVNSARLAVVSSHLRAMYEDLLTEPVPERLLGALRRLERIDEPH
jgi:Anti-sigma factor NepR